MLIQIQYVIIRDKIACIHQIVTTIAAKRVLFCYDVIGAILPAAIFLLAPIYYRQK